MLRRVLTLLFMLMVLACAFAEEKAWITPYNVAAIDMTTNDFPGTTTGVWESSSGRPSSGKYNDDSMIGLIGVSGTSEEKTVTFDFSSAAKAWKYVSSSNSSLCRPFGIDLVLRGGTQSDSTGYIIGNTHKTISVLHLGYYDTSITEPQQLVASIVLPKTDGSANSSTFGGEAYVGAWVDVVLVLPGTVEDAGYIDLNGNDYPDSNELEYCKLGAANDYSTQFTCTLGGESSHVFVMSGYYNMEPPVTSGSVALVVNPLSGASNLDIKSLVDNPTEIAEYSFSATSGYVPSGNSTWSNTDYYFFISSDTVGGNKFELKLSGTEGIGLNKYIGVNYVVGLLSSYDSSASPSLWFDGTDSLTYTTAHHISSNFPKAQSRVDIAYSYDVSKSIYQFFDTGSIYIKLPSGADVDDLMAGRYKSNIYFNVVTNQ